MAIAKESEIVIKVGTDENNIPERLSWNAQDGDTSGDVKAMLLSVWDEKSRNSMRIDLWTKEMTVDEMKMFVHQTLVSMAETFERATGEQAMALSMKDFSEYFAEKMKLMQG